jgi:hypothetical protein
MAKIFGMYCYDFVYAKLRLFIWYTYNFGDVIAWHSSESDIRDDISKTFRKV